MLLRILLRSYFAEEGLYSKHTLDGRHLHHLKYPNPRKKKQQQFGYGPMGSARCPPSTVA